MKTLVVSIAMLALCPAFAAAFPDSFGLPHFVQMDDLSYGQSIDRMPTGSIVRENCTTRQKTTIARHAEGKAVRKQAPQN